MFCFSLSLFFPSCLPHLPDPKPHSSVLFPPLQFPVPEGLHWPRPTSGFSVFFSPWKLCFLAMRSQLCYFSNFSCATSTSSVLITGATESTYPILLSWTAAIAAMPVSLFFSCLHSCCILCCPESARPRNRARHVTCLGACWTNGGKNNFEFNILTSIEKLHLLLKPFSFSFFLVPGEQEEQHRGVSPAGCGKLTGQSPTFDEV